MTNDNDDKVTKAYLEDVEKWKKLKKKRKGSLDILWMMSDWAKKYYRPEEDNL